MSKHYGAERTAARRLTEAAEAFGRYADALEDLAKVMAELRAQAAADDPGLLPHLARASAIDPEVGWLDVAAERERLGGLDQRRRGFRSGKRLR
jgi:hypothetical protein